MKKKQDLASKLKKLILRITILSVLVVVLFSIGALVAVRQQTLDSVVADAFSRLQDIAANKAEIADAQLLRAQNQTKLVAEGMTDILTNADRSLAGYDEALLPNLTCATPELLGKYSLHIRAPETLLQNIQTDAEGTVTYAELNRDADIGPYTVNQELYLGSLLNNELAQIEHFRNEDGTFTGFSATYFCFADSGIDVLGDLETQTMVAYDARERGWYMGAVDAWKNDTLRNGVYWTEPTLDASGRGIALICAAPVVVNGSLAGVAGNGGLLINLIELVESTRLADSGFSFIVNRENSKVIINPTPVAEDAKQSEVAVETILSSTGNESLSSLAQTLKNEETGTTTCFIDGYNVLIGYSALKNTDWVMVTAIPEDDPLIMGTVNKLENTIFFLLVLFVVLVIVLTISIIASSKRFAKKFTAPIVLLKEGAEIISSGNLQHRLDISTGDELEELSGAFNHMAGDLDDYIKNLAAITAEKERIGAELNVATQIQASMLPCIFPAFPNRTDFDIYATMTPAKEVGGDFYDFFMVDDRHLAIVMADVSGKGVPAALFMVIGKTLIKDHTQPDCDLGTTFMKVNDLLCEANSEGLFITAFEGVLDLVTGEFTYVNAGHEMPFIAHSGEPYKAFPIRPAFVLAGMEGMRYKAGSMQLAPGDKVFQYTDGVTEATNAGNELYGMDRLENILNQNRDADPAALLPAIKADIDRFVGDAPQFDDITMLSLSYKKRMVVSPEE